MHDIPPPGPALPFVDFARTIHVIVARALPTLRLTTTRSPKAQYRWRYGDHCATLSLDGDVYRLTFRSEQGRTTMASLIADDRRDAFVAENFAWSLAGYFDPAFATPKRAP